MMAAAAVAQLSVGGGRHKLAKADAGSRDSVRLGSAASEAATAACLEDVSATLACAQEYELELITSCSLDSFGFARKRRIKATRLSMWSLHLSQWKIVVGGGDSAAHAQTLCKDSCSKAARC